MIPNPKNNGSVLGDFLAALLLVLFLVLLCAIAVRPLNAQDLPSAPGKTYWAETAALTASNVIDGYSTIAEQRLSPRVTELPFPQGSRWLLGPRPSYPRYFACMGGLQLLTQVAAYRLERSPRRFNRLAGHGLMAYATYGHVDGAVSNFRGMERVPR